MAAHEDFLKNVQVEDPIDEGAQNGVRQMLNSPKKLGISLEDDSPRDSSALIARN